MTGHRFEQGVFVTADDRPPEQRASCCLRAEMRKRDDYWARLREFSEDAEAVSQGSQMSPRCSRRKS